MNLGESTKEKNEILHAISAANLNGQMKDAFFKKVFESEQRKKRLVIFLDGIEPTEIQVAQVIPIIFGSKENDLSFLCNQTYYYMMEQQSSFNPNMSYRMLEYITAGFRTLIEDKAQVYGTKELSFPVPKLFTIFTGCNSRVSDQILDEQRLSELYLITEPNPDLELVVHTYNFRMSPMEVLNYMNEERIPVRFEAYEEEDLFWYGMFTNCATYLMRIEKYSKLNVECKIKTIPQLCQMFLERGIFIDLFKSKEVCDMAVVQYSRDEQLRWEGREEGIEIGKEEGIEIGIFKTISILKKLRMSESLILSEIQEEYQLSSSEAKEMLKNYSNRTTNS